MALRDFGDAAVRSLEDQRADLALGRNAHGDTRAKRFPIHDQAARAEPERLHMIDGCMAVRQQNLLGRSTAGTRIVPIGRQQNAMSRVDQGACLVSTFPDMARIAVEHDHNHVPVGRRRRPPRQEFHPIGRPDAHGVHLRNTMVVRLGNRLVGVVHQGPLADIETTQHQHIQCHSCNQQAGHGVVLCPPRSSVA